jgi:hypothetical protein
MAESIGEDVVELLSRWMETTDEEVQYVKTQVQNVLIKITDEPIECCLLAPTRLPQNEALECEGYDLMICKTRGEYPIYRVKVCSLSGEISQVHRQTLNGGGSVDDIVALDESLAYPVKLDDMWEIQHNGEIAQFYNHVTKEHSALELTFPKHNGCDYQNEELYNYHGLEQVLMPSTESRRRFDKFHRFPHYDCVDEGVYALMLEINHCGKNTIPCLVAPSRGIVVITDYTGIYDYPLPLAGKVSDDGTQLIYRFYTDQPLEEMIYRCETVKSPVGFNDFTHYKINNSTWTPVSTVKDFELKPLLRLGGGFLATTIACNECDEPIQDEQKCSCCTECFDYLCCAGCTSKHDESHTLIECNSFEDILNSYTITLE